MEYRINPDDGKAYTRNQYIDAAYTGGSGSSDAELINVWEQGELLVVESYDSSADTLVHIKRVNHLLLDACKELMRRAQVHDTSKLQEPEKAEFDRLTPILKSLVYGTPEYAASLKKLKVALDHHYANNSHHPEHYTLGIDDMDLFDVIEMLLDWKAATERTAGGDLNKSIDINATRFNMSPQLVCIFKNTVKYLK